MIRKVEVEVEVYLIKIFNFIYCRMYLEYDYLYTGCPTKHARWWIVLNVFFHYSLSRLIPKTIKKYYMESYYSKINFKVNIFEQIFCLHEINCKQPLVFDTVYWRRHSEQSTNSHVSWGTYTLHNLQPNFNSVVFILVKTTSLRLNSKYIR